MITKKKINEIIQSIIDDLKPIIDKHKPIQWHMSLVIWISPNETLESNASVFSDLSLRDNWIKDQLSVLNSKNIKRYYIVRDDNPVPITTPEFQTYYANLPDE